MISNGVDGGLVRHLVPLLMCKMNAISEWNSFLRDRIRRIESLDVELFQVIGIRLKRLILRDVIALLLDESVLDFGCT